MEVKALKYIAFISALVYLLSCEQKQDKVEVNFGVNNFSETIPKIKMLIFLDNALIIEDTFQRLSNDQVYNFHLPEGSHLLKVLTSDKTLVQEEKFTINENDTLIGIFIRFDYYQPDSAAINSFKSHIKENYPSEYDTVIAGREKRILIRIVNNGKVIKEW